MSVDTMRAKLAKKRSRADLRYRYYEMKYNVVDFGISTPPNLRAIKNNLGWCGKAVDALADRLIFRRFENDVFGFGEILADNNPDIIIDSAILSALITSCSFFYIAPDSDGYPRMQVIDGRNATGDLDPITGMLKEGYAVLDTDEFGNATLEAYFTPEYTEFYAVDKQPTRINNPALYPMLVPMIYRPDAKRPFGHSRISRSCMDLVQAASRTVKRSEISAEFYSFPQKYVVGLAEDAEIENKWAASMSSMMAFYKDEDGDRPVVGQFQQQSMAPHMEQLRQFASLFAAETGLTVDDLGFVSANPSSAEAIKASHEALRLNARKAQRNFASGIKNAFFVAASVRDQKPYSRILLSEVGCSWEPIFEPDAAMLSGIGDGIIKLNQAVPGYVGGDNLVNLTGILPSKEPVEGGEDIG